MSIIDLRELAKSLMFAEKAKEEAEELRRDNERLYEITVEHTKHFEKDQQTILNLKQTILNLEFKVQKLEEGAAAPDLLEALEALIEDQRDASLPVLAQARAAIAKAKGEA